MAADGDPAQQDRVDHRHRAGVGDHADRAAKPAFLPLALWRFVTVPAVRPVQLAWAVGIAAQAVSYLTSPRPHLPGTPPMMSIADGYVLDVGMPIISSRSHLLGAAIVRWGWWPGFAGVAGLLLFAGVGFCFARTPARVLLISLIVGSVASWVLSYVVNNAADHYYSLWTADRLTDVLLIRWGTAASMMLAATILITVSVLLKHVPTWWPAAIAALGLYVGVMAVDLTYRVPVDGSTWSSQITSAQTTCRPTRASSCISSHIRTGFWACRARSSAAGTMGSAAPLRRPVCDLLLECRN